MGPVEANTTGPIIRIVQPNVAQGENGGTESRASAS